MLGSCCRRCCSQWPGARSQPAPPLLPPRPCSFEADELVEAVHLASAQAGTCDGRGERLNARQPHKVPWPTTWGTLGVRQGEGAKEAAHSGKLSLQAYTVCRCSGPRSLSACKIQIYQKSTTFSLSWHEVWVRSLMLLLFHQLQAHYTRHRSPNTDFKIHTSHFSTYHFSTPYMPLISQGLFPVPLQYTLHATHLPGPVSSANSMNSR